MKKTTTATIGLGLIAGGLLYFFTRPASAAGAIEEEEEEIKNAGTGARGASIRVPAKVGTQKWNQALFPNEPAIQGKLAGLSFKYAPASVAANLPAVVEHFQADWNHLALLDGLAPPRLNRTVLVQDGVAGGQTLRALEWALAMGWPERLVNAGLGL